MPHADYHKVKASKVVVCTLKKEVVFKRMDDPAEELPVKMVIMLALNEPHGHLEMLQKIMGLIQNKEIMKDLVQGKSADYIYKILSEKI